jgi:hypothetical protein
MSNLRQILVCLIVITSAVTGGFGCGGDRSDSIDKAAADIDSSPEAAEARSELLLNQDPTTLGVQGDESSAAPQAETQ